MCTSSASHRGAGGGCVVQGFEYGSSSKCCSAVQNTAFSRVCWASGFVSPFLPKSTCEAPAPASAACVAGTDAGAVASIASARSEREMSSPCSCVMCRLVSSGSPHTVSAVDKLCGLRSAWSAVAEAVSLCASPAPLSAVAIGEPRPSSGLIREDGEDATAVELRGSQRAGLQRTPSSSPSPQPTSSNYFRAVI